MSALLVVEGLQVSYGPVQVLFGVDLEVPERGRVALLGTNGAGKSTLLKAVSGLLRPTRGTIVFDGQDITSLAPDERVRRGLVQIGGGRATFPSLSVEDNLRMGAWHHLEDKRRVAAELEQVYAVFPILRDRSSQPAGTLSGGEQQMMALGRALVACPRLLMIDELSLGLAPVVMQDILRMVDELVARGVALVIVEQSLNVAMAVTDQAYFLEKGEVRFSGRPSELLERGDLARSVFFGSDAAADAATEVVS